MRSARRDFSNWRAVPQGLRIKWGDFDPDEAMPPWSAVTRVRAAFAKVAAGFSAAFALCYVTARVLLEGCRAAPARIGRDLSHRTQSADRERRGRKRFSVIVLLQRNMLHFECKVARA